MYALTNHNTIIKIIDEVDDRLFFNRNGLKSFVFNYEVKEYNNWKFILRVKRFINR